MLFQESDTWKGEYPVADSQEVEMEAHLGDGAVGGLVVNLGPEQLASGDPILLAPLGTGSALRGLGLQVVARARQVIPKATWVSLHLSLKGGLQPIEIVLRQLPATGAAATFLVRVSFPAQASKP